MKYIEIKAPAKINIGLNIVKKRDDGFHNLETFFYPINDLFDELTFERSDKFSFEMKETSIKYQDKLQSNLVVKAKNILEEKTGKKLTAKITLKKNIPIGAGLGGGSSDAASTLICINEMFKLKIKN
jgi:4-diphosphocytidyl-2-C-methyl-D-erythritol kinase